MIENYLKTEDNDMAWKILRPQWADSRSIRGVLFDMDGLVLDTEKLYSRFWRAACEAFGFSMSYEQSLKMRALNKQAGAGMLCSFFGPEADYAAIRQKRIELMDACVAREGVQIKPGIPELLAGLKARGIATAITSSSPMERIELYLGSVGLLDCFDRICSGYQVAHGKPEPDIFLFGAQQLGLTAGECLALEDSHAGLLSAHRAGCLPVLIPDLDSPNETTLPLLYALADSGLDVLELLDNLPPA